MEAVLPDLVTTDEGYEAAKCNQLPFHMQQAIKDLKAENDRLKQLLQTQKKRLRRLEQLANK